MTTHGAQKLILGSAVLTFGMVAISEVAPTSIGGKGQLPSWKSVVGGLITATLLTIVAEPAPEIAGGLAVAIGGTAFVTQGLPVLLKYTGADQPQGLTVSQTNQVFKGTGLTVYQPAGIGTPSRSGTPTTTGTD